MRHWMNLFEVTKYPLKNGEFITLSIQSETETSYYGEDDEFELEEEFLNITAYNEKKEAVAHGKFDLEDCSFRGIEVKQKYRRVGIATAIYDELNRIGYRVKPSSSLEPDGEKFWNNRLAIK